MAQHWRETTINIEHPGEQNLQQGETVEKSDNILYNTNGQDYATVLQDLCQREGTTFYSGNPVRTARELEQVMGREQFNEAVREGMIALHANDRSKQIEGAAEVFELKTGMAPSENRKKYEKIREASIESMRQNPVYQFCMLLAGFNNQKMTKYWLTPSESESKSRANKRSVETKTMRANSSHDENFHRWYTETVWADGLIHLSPTIYAHMEEAYLMVTNKWRHLKGTELKYFITSPDIRSYFARIISWNMRTSDVLSGQRYHLNSTYRRVNMEKAKLLNLFRHVKMEGYRLVYRRDSYGGSYVAGSRDQESINAYLDSVAISNRNTPYRAYDNKFRGPTDPSTLATMAAYVERQKQLINSMNNNI
jgi:hypothetical protein